jgi:hypothetical protein
MYLLYNITCFQASCYVQETTYKSNEVARYLQTSYEQIQIQHNELRREDRHCDDPVTKKIHSLNPFHGPA